MNVLVLAPHPDDGHPDHEVSLEGLRSAFHGSGLRSPSLRAYEIWTPLSRYDCVEDITGRMPRKLRAVRAHRSQLGGFDYLRAVRGLNQYRGELAGKCRYAEVFQTMELKV